MSSLYNLFKLAKDNEPILQKRFIGVKKREEAKGIAIDTIFAYLDEHLNFSINFTAANLQYLAKDNIYKSAYKRFEGNKKKIYSHFGERKEQRLEFDSRFENSVDFKYAALNCGNIGLTYWGDYCLLFDLKEYEKSNAEIVFLQRNSLQKTDNRFYYFDNDTELNIGKLLQESGTSTTKNELICIKLAGKMSQVDDLPDLVCDSEGTEYIEMIFIEGNIIPYLLKAVTTKDTYRAFNKAILKRKSKNITSELLQQYKNIHQFLEDNSIVLSLA